MKWIVKSQIITGKANKKCGIKCQDKIHYINNEEIICAALADGAGCANFGDLGADIAVKTACEYIKKNFDYLFKLEEEKVKYKIFSCIIREFRKLIIERNVILRDLASTLLVMAVKGDKYIMISLGDGYIGYVKNKKLKTMFYFDSNITNKKKFLTSSPMCYEYAELKRGNINDLNTFFICSDGFIDCFHNYNNLLDKNLYNVVKSDKKLDEVMNSDKIIDDSSYILVVKN